MVCKIAATRPEHFDAGLDPPEGTEIEPALVLRKPLPAEAHRSQLLERCAFSRPHRELEHLPEHLADEVGADRRGLWTLQLPLFRTISRAPSPGGPDHRALFDRAVDITAFWSVSSPAEFVGAREGVEARLEDATARAAFVSAASVYFSSRYKGRYCDVRWYPEDDEVNILVLHGKNSRTANVEQDGAESTLNYREISQDSIRYHAASGRVRVGAAAPPDRRKLVELFAEHLLGDPEFFTGSDADQLYTLDPIRTQGSDFRFRRGWDKDVLSVTVREIQIDEGEHMADGKVRFSPWAMTVRDNHNAIDRVIKLASDVDFADLRINYVVLDFRFDGVKNPVRVKVKPPSVASFRDHSFEKTIMEHLERNGIRIANTSQSASAAAE